MNSPLDPTLSDYPGSHHLLAGSYILRVADRTASGHPVDRITIRHSTELGRCGRDCSHSRQRGLRTRNKLAQGYAVCPFCVLKPLYARIVAET